MKTIDFLCMSEGRCEEYFEMVIKEREAEPIEINLGILFLVLFLPCR